MKRLAQIIVLLLCLASAAPAGAQIVNPNGGGGGGSGSGVSSLAGLTGAIPIDSSLGIGTSDILGVAVTPQQFGAKCNVQTAYNGRITSGQAVLTDTTDHPFVASDVGKYIAVWTAGSGGTTLYTTILSYQSSSQVTLAANASTTVSGTNPANGEGTFVWLTDDHTAIQAAENYLCSNSTQGILYVPGLCGNNSQINMCESDNVVIMGDGSGFLSAPQYNGSPSVYPKSGFITGTNSMTADTASVAFDYPDGGYVSNTTYQIKDMAIQPAGNPLDKAGGCSTCDGVDNIDWEGVTLSHDNVSGWGRYDTYVDVATSNVLDYSGLFTLDGGIYEYAGSSGFQAGGVAGTGGHLEGLYMINDVALFSNGGPGFKLSSSAFNVLIDGAHLGYNTTDEIAISAQATGCLIEGSYVQTITTSPTTNGILDDPQAQADAISGCSILASHVSGPGTGGGIVLGPSGALSNAEIVGNYVSGYSTNIAIDNIGVFVTIHDNSSGPTDYAEMCINSPAGCHNLQSGDVGPYAELDGSGSGLGIPIWRAVQTSNTGSSNYVGGFEVANNASSDTEKRAIAIFDYSDISQATHAEGNMILGQNNAGTFQINADMFHDGGFLLSPNLSPPGTDPGPGNFRHSGYENSSTSASISGGGSLATGSNAMAGRITGLAATANVLTPGFTCPNAVTCVYQDDTTAGGVLVTAQNATTSTFSATASDTADYVCSCR